MQKFFTALAALFCFLTLPAQVILKEQHRESDGFSYTILKTEQSPVYYGVANAKGKVVVPLDRKYKYVYYGRKKDFFNFTPDGDHYGIVDIKGKIVIPPEYSLVVPQEHNDIIWFELINDNGKEGCADEKGNILIPPQYDNVSLLGDKGQEYFGVSIKNWNGIANLKGKEIIPPVYKSVIRLSEKSIDYYKLTYGRKEGICDIQGNIIIPPIYESVHYTESKKRAFFITQSDGKKGLCNTSGEIILNNQYDGILLNSDDKLKVKTNSGQWMEAEIVASTRPGPRPVYTHYLCPYNALTFKDFFSPSSDVVEKIHSLCKQAIFPLYLAPDDFIMSSSAYAEGFNYLINSEPLFPVESLEAWISQWEYQKNVLQDTTYYDFNLPYNDDKIILGSLVAIGANYDTAPYDVSHGVHGVQFTLAWEEKGDIRMHTDIIETYLSCLEQLYGEPTKKMELDEQEIKNFLGDPERETMCVAIWNNYYGRIELITDKYKDSSNMIEIHSVFMSDYWRKIELIKSKLE